MRRKTLTQRHRGTEKTSLRLSLCLCVSLSMILLAGCRQDMHDQPRYVPLRPSDFFGDRRSARQPVEGTIARGHLDADVAFYQGKGPDGKPVADFPFPVTKEVIERGHQRFNIYCTPCHDRTGSGQGMIVRRGYRQPPSYHTDRLRQVPNGYIFDVITVSYTHLTLPTILRV